MPRRPMLFAACGCMAAVMISYYAGSGRALVVLLTGFALLLVNQRMTRQSIIRAAVLIVMVTYCLGMVSFWHTDRQLTEQGLAMEGTELIGVITDCVSRKSPAGDPYLQLEVRSGKGRAVVKCYESCRISGEAAAGCPAVVQGEMGDPAPRRNPGCFDYALYLRSQGVVKTVTAKTLTVEQVRPFREAPFSRVLYTVYQSRETCIDHITRGAGEETAALLRAILFGDKGSLDEDVLDSFRKNGTAHILAVSGLHIGIIYGFILKLWRWKRRWTFFFFNLTFFILYAAAAGFSPSVTRAVIMVLLHIIAGIRNERYDLSNAAFLIVCGVLLRNPYMLFNAGFQMSFLAVLSMALVMPYFRHLYSGIFLSSLVIQIGLGPFIIYSFNYLSLLAVFINVPVVALAGILVPSALVLMALSSFSLFEPAVRILHPMCSALMKLNETTQIDGVTSFQTPSPPLWLLAAYYLCLLVFATEEGRLAISRVAHRGRYILTMLLLVLVLSTGFAAFASDGFEDCNLMFVDVGQGDCVCVRTGGGLAGKQRCYLFDGGGSANYNVGKSVLRNVLLKNGMARADGAFVTHLHTDHYKGICELAREGMVERVYLYEANRIKQKQVIEDTGLAPENIVYLAAGDRVVLGGSRSGGLTGMPVIGKLYQLLNEDYVYLDVLCPARHSQAEYERLLADETDENALSLVFRVAFSWSGAESEDTGDGGTEVLITGDMGEEGESELLRTYRGSSALHADILKVGHHGSSTSTSEAFLDAVQPQLAVIQVGENNMYGHPTPEVLARLQECSVPVFRNDLQGAVGMEIAGGRIREIRTIL